MHDQTLVKALREAGASEDKIPGIVQILKGKITEDVVLRQLPETVAGIVTRLHHAVQMPYDVPILTQGATCLVQGILQDLQDRDMVGYSPMQGVYHRTPSLEGWSDLDLITTYYRESHYNTPIAIRVQREINRRAALYVPGVRLQESREIVAYAAHGHLTPERIATYYKEKRADLGALQKAVDAGLVSVDVLTFLDR